MAPSSRGYFFVRFVSQDAVEATANEAVAAGYWPVDWERISDDGEPYQGGATWMVYGELPPPDTCPLCGCTAPEEPEE